MNDLNHFDGKGNAVMVDLSDKPESERMAVARGRVLMGAETIALIKERRVAKGDVLAVAQLAGVMAAKRTPDLIPLCHTLALTSVVVELNIDEAESAVDIVATCRTFGRTGVEMEAMTAVTVAALTVYDMVKAADRGVRLTDIRLVLKAGGKSGEWAGA